MELVIIALVLVGGFIAYKSFTKKVSVVEEVKAEVAKVEETVAIAEVVPFPVTKTKAPAKAKAKAPAKAGAKKPTVKKATTRKPKAAK